MRRSTSVRIHGLLIAAIAFLVGGCKESASDLRYTMRRSDSTLHTITIDVHPVGEPKEIVQTVSVPVDPRTKGGKVISTDKDGKKCTVKWSEMPVWRSIAIESVTWEGVEILPSEQETKRLARNRKNREEAVKDLSFTLDLGFGKSNGAYQERTGYVSIYPKHKFTSVQLRYVRVYFEKHVGETTDGDAKVAWDLKKGTLQVWYKGVLATPAQGEMAEFRQAAQMAIADEKLCYEISEYSGGDLTVNVIAPASGRSLRSLVIRASGLNGGLKSRVGGESTPHWETQIGKKPLTVSWNRDKGTVVVKFGDRVIPRCPKRAATPNPILNWKPPRSRFFKKRRVPFKKP